MRALTRAGARAHARFPLRAAARGPLRGDDMPPQPPRVRPSLHAAHRAVSLMETVCGWVASACLFAIMVTVFADVAMRYLLNAPLTWSYDFVSLYLMVALFFLALSVTLRDGHHVRVDILWTRCRPRIRHAMELICNALTAVVMFAIVVQGGLKTWDSWQADAVVAGAIPWPTWAMAVFVPIGAGLLLLRLLLSLWSLAAAVADGSEAAVGGVAEARAPGEHEA
ncbi:MAG: TRAP transporter small permease [Burkholderiaceae bacterium]|nr:TRAP transporter small permease [Burkholderiaceae bacterium]